MLGSSTPPRTQAVLEVDQEGSATNSEALTQENAKQVLAGASDPEVYSSLTLQGWRATQVLADAPSMDAEVLR